MATVAAPSSSPNPQAGHTHAHSHSHLRSQHQHDASSSSQPYPQDIEADAPSSSSFHTSHPSSSAHRLPSDSDGTLISQNDGAPQHNPQPLTTHSSTLGSISLHQDGAELSIDTHDCMDVLCGGCSLIINEDSADGGVIHFANQLWHVECFRCAKCHQKVSTDRDDILLLSDGHPICGQCNYSCQICGLPILEEAIMTGDESYHASCFTCRSCNSRIEELVFAKTSQGIYCMPCHNERVARSRRHADNKRRTKNKDGTRSKTKASQDRSVPGSTTATTDDYSVPGSHSGHSHQNQLAAASSDSHVTSTNFTPEAQQQPLSPRPSLTSKSDGLKVSEDQPATHTLPSPTKRDFAAGSPVPSPTFNTARPGSATGGPTLRELREGISNKALKPRPSDLHNRPSPSLTAPESARSPKSPLAAGSTSDWAQSDGTGNRTPLSPSRGTRRDVKRRSSDPDTREVAEALKNLTTSGSAPHELGRSSAVGLGIGSHVDKDSTSGQSHHEIERDPDESLTPTNSTSRSDLQHLGPTPAPPERPSIEIEVSDQSQSDAQEEGPPVPISKENDQRRQPSPSSASSGVLNADQSRSAQATPDVDSEDDVPLRSEVKRASKLSFTEHPVQSLEQSSAKAPAVPPIGLVPPSSVDEKIAGFTSSFSFYDPDLMNLMDSFGQFDNVDGLQLSSPVGSRFSEPLETDDARVATTESKTSLSSVGTSGSTNSSGKDLVDTKQDDLVKSPSGSSIHTISAQMRESMKRASNGQVAMDTSFIETILQELEDTKVRMKTLQTKYDRMKRASAHAAQGFSHAKTEFEQQVHAREEAELEMLMLRRKLADQASKLADISKQEQQQERLAIKTRDFQSSLEDMSKNLAKLTVERDMTAAEVAELIAMQEGKTKAPDHADVEETGKTLQSRLSVRLDGVKAKYRKEISELTDKRNALLLEIEDLKQSRDVYLEETETLNARNEDLNALLSKLSSRAETLSAAEAAAGGRSPRPSQGSSTTSGKGGFGFGFGGNRAKNAASPSFAQDNLLGSSSGHSAHDSDAAPGFARGGLNLQSQAAAAARAEALAAAGAASSNNVPQPAQAKKFKWMKPMAKSAGQGIAAALPMVHGVPPVPPKNGASGPGAGLGQQPQPHLQQQALVQQHIQQQQQQREQAQDMIVREHKFAPTNILRPTRCISCQKNMWGQSEVRCNTCGQVCHTKCLPSLTISCSQPYMRNDEAATEPVGPSMFGRSLVEQSHSESRDVPLIVEKCIQAVEANGMDYEGIYRKSGGTSQLKIITQLFERGQRFDLDDQDRFNDVSAVTSVLKNYFRELPEPLLTYALHDEFIQAAQNPDYRADPGAKEAKMRELIAALPTSHRETLRVLCVHLGRVARRAEENRMNARNLGVVFGPTLMRSADASREFSEMGQKSMTVEWLCEHSDIFGA